MRLYQARRLRPNETLPIITRTSFRRAKRLASVQGTGPNGTLERGDDQYTVIVREEGLLKGGLKRRVLTAVVYAERPPVSPLPD